MKSNSLSFVGRVGVGGGGNGGFLRSKEPTSTKYCTTDRTQESSCRFQGYKTDTVRAAGWTHTE